MERERDKHVPLNEYTKYQASISTLLVVWHAVHLYGVAGFHHAEAEMRNKFHKE